jgi:hypothetical protein
MGYDNNVRILAIPLIYVWKAVTYSVYHVSNSDATP